MKIIFLSLIASALAAAAPPDYSGATVIVYNETLPESKQLGEFYAKARHIPEANLVGVRASVQETISREEFATTIETPLRQAFTERQWWTLAATPEGQAAATNTKRVLAVMEIVEDFLIRRRE